MTKRTEKIEVGILGCTGMVGQKLISLLCNHPLFQVTSIAASASSCGKIYSEHVNWKEAKDIPPDVGKMKIKECGDVLKEKILFSGLDSKVAGEFEESYAKNGHIVISNSKNHRMNNDVPLVIPEINADHLKLIETQKRKYNSSGFIVTNPNCTITVVAMALFPIYKKLGLSNVFVTSMQAISGAGYPGVSALDILGNVIPYIDGEEDKVETEMLKIFGKYNGNEIKFADFKVSAMCNRVPVLNGHTIAISFETREKADREYMVNLLSGYEDIGLPYKLQSVLRYFEDKRRPQPALDLLNGDGMVVSVGNLRKCNVLDWKFTAFGHNTIRGAAGASILNGEYIVGENIWHI